MSTIDEQFPYQLFGISQADEPETVSKRVLEKKALAKMQALLAKWLCIQNLMLLTGAGNSNCEDSLTSLNLQNNFR